MNSPEISFSKWVPWKDRKKITGNLPGLYLIAEFNQTPPAGKADPLSKEIVYIGETCDRTLTRRFYEFNRSAFQSKTGHSGGWSYNDAFKDNGDDVYVSVLPVNEETDFPSALIPVFIRFVERKLIWDFACKYDKMPPLNNK